VKQLLPVILAGTAAFGCEATPTLENEVSELSQVEKDIDPEVLDRIKGASQILGLLQENGEILTDERPVILYFFGEQVDLNRLKADKALSGYNLRDGVETQMLIAEGVAVTDEEWAVVTAHDMVMLARKYGVDYDGWEAGTTRQSGTQ